MERRRDPRFELGLKCMVQRRNSGQIAEGTTINIGRSGALIHLPISSRADSLPQLGDALLTEVQLPQDLHLWVDPDSLWGEARSPADLAFGARCLNCDGVAIRTARNGNGYLVAVHFERIELGVLPATQLRYKTAVM